MSGNLKFTKIILGLLFMVLTISGCASGAQAVRTATGSEDVPNVSDEDVITNIDDLMAALQAADHPVSLGEVIEQEFFSIKGQKLIVNGEEVQEFIYADEGSRKADSDKISNDGSAIGTSMVTWIDQPNFWAKGPIIALYVGKDATVIELLTRVLGEPITSHD